jgi:hypothetical protein
MNTWTNLNERNACLWAQITNLFTCKNQGVSVTTSDYGSATEQTTRVYTRGVGNVEIYGEKMSTRNISGSKRRPARKSDNFNAASQLSRICASLDVSQPHGPASTAWGTALPFLLSNTKSWEQCKRFWWSCVRHWLHTYIDRCFVVTTTSKILYSTLGSRTFWGFV